MKGLAKPVKMLGQVECMMLFRRGENKIKKLLKRQKVEKRPSRIIPATATGNEAQKTKPLDATAN